MVQSSDARCIEIRSRSDLYNKGDYKAALAEFQDIALERPDAAGAWYYIGLCQFKLKRYDRVELPLAHPIDLLEIQTPATPAARGL